ncbi:GNAT family N-acetyltransferase [Vagococcus salmoninarum]|uniref:GNAT family N-acetyltransferase n=1 Tax=Vagococcus salmoninarum TaxID=2739 RepID=A0A429ZKG5_9ENTE|nr:GNAT family N-acetyltransferase [Vagococcus salmoninarum]RST94156.1 GNAT family N-acetyltransferase [Vagococcus salmoninarum]
MPEAYRFSDNQVISQEQLLELYGSVGWTAYTDQPALLQQAVAKSLKVISLWQGEKLCGLIRVVGDGLTIIYIQDILVNPSFQKQGLGSQLMTKIFEAYPEVRQKVLLTEETPGTRRFYESLGFNSCDDGNVVAFGKFK